MRKIILLSLLILVIGLLAGCVRQQPAESTASPENPTTIRIAAMRGPTALGLLHLMDNAEQGHASNNYEFKLLGSPDEVPPLLVRGEIDIAAVPGNLAAVLYNRLEGEVQALAVVTLGVLHIVDTTNTIYSVADLAGRTIFVSGQGATPEFALNYVLTQNGLTPGVDVNISFHAEQAEIAALLETGQAEIALLPEPFVSTVLARVDNLRLALDLTQEWDHVQQDYSLIMSVVIARREFLENNPRAVAAFMEEYATSIEFMTTRIPEGAQLAADFGLIPSTYIAEAALPRTHMVFLTGEEMRRNLMGFYNVLYNAEPASIGGELPEEDFFFLP